VPGRPLPILIGGHSDAAFKRAARFDGFMFAGGGPDELAGPIAAINAARAEAGTTGRPFRIFATAIGDFSADTIRRLEDLGVTDMPVAFRNLYAVEEDGQPLADKIDAMKRFADTVIAKA
jgi:alkanesulfonate monooxygenase SsuD/methylene tetrahydromethanopterin reductase-like flavin-dependent oxidoreductase (luciferase family)